MTTALPTALATSQAGTLHRRQLRAAGLDRRAVDRRVRLGELVEIAPNVFLVGGTEAGWRQQIWTGLLTARSDAVIGHRTAARLGGFWRFGAGEIDVLEVENTDHRISRAAGHRSSWLPPHHRTTIDGIPVTTPARTLFDLAGLVSVKRWVRGWPSITRIQAARALDDALGRDLSLDALHEVLTTMGKRGRPGTVLFRELLEARGEGFVATESVLEDLLVEVLVAHGLPAPIRQKTLGTSTAPIGRVDFVYIDQRVVIEADGRQHHSALLDAEADRWRDLELGAAGWTVIRVSWHQLVEQPGRFVAHLAQILDRRSGGAIDS